jgi:hypothetical protein
MFASILTISFVLLVLSYIIARLSRIDDPHRNLVGYLYSGNNHWLAMTSNVGALLSIAHILGSYYAGILGFGSIAVVSLVAGMIVGYVLLGGGMFLLVRRKDYHCTQYEHVTFVDLLAPPGTWTHGVFSALIILGYILGCLSEFIVLGSLMQHLFPGSLAPIALMVVVGVLCATYTSVGGYSGILRADVFQLLVFAGACGYLLWETRHQTGDVLHALPDRLVRTGPAGPVAFALMVAAGFVGYPDVWIRNVSTLRTPPASRLWWIVGSFLLLGIAVVPVTIPALFPLADLSKFDNALSLPKAHQYLAEALTSSRLFGESSFAFSLLVATIFCAFVTTINTWLMTIMQHLGNAFGYRNVNAVTMAPFAVMLIVLFGAAFLKDDLMLPVGLTVFPFAFFATLLYFGAIFPVLRPLLASPAMSGLVVGETVTWVMVYWNWRSLEAWSGHIMLASAAGVYLTFLLVAVVVGFCRFRRWR